MDKQELQMEVDILDKYRNKLKNIEQYTAKEFIKKHENWINYFNGIILPNGKLIDANGAQTSIFEAIYCNKYNLDSKDFILNGIPEDYYFDVDSLILPKINIIYVRYNFQYIGNSKNYKGKNIETLNYLINNKIIENNKRYYI